MKVRMRTNLGTVHAAAIGVKASECLQGMEPEVSEDAGQWLVKRRMADEVPVIHAVPRETMMAVPPAAIHPKPAPLAARTKPSDKSPPHKEA